MALAFRIDPWASEYESALQMEEPGDDASEVPVRLDAETDDWRLIDDFEPRPLPSPVAFIDGVQRVELRVVSSENGSRVYGAFASVGVGAVFAGEGEPSLAPERPDRALALSSGVSDEARSIRCGDITLEFEACSDSTEGYTGVKLALDKRRRDREERLGERLVDEGCPLVIADGRLRFRTMGASAVGLTKTLHRTYLPEPQWRLLEELRPRTRTPVVEIRYHESVYSWWTRLAEPGPIDHPLAGIVRLETMASIGIERAVSLADLTTQHLPRFASSPIWDPRAPQNLYPFAALEQRLRHELGDHNWIRRAIESHILGGGP